MLYPGTDPESYITEYTSVYEDTLGDVTPQILGGGEVRTFIFDIYANISKIEINIHVNTRYVCLLRGLRNPRSPPCG